MGKSTIVQVVIVALLGLVIAFYHEDMILMAGTIINGSSDNGNNILIPIVVPANAGQQYQVLLDDDTYWQSLINAAEEANYSCTNNNKPTSINATILGGISILNDDDEEEHDNYNYVGKNFISLDIAFYAHDIDSNYKKTGGDVFIVDYQTYWKTTANSSSSNNNYTVFKSSTYTHDHFDGIYSARLFFPRIKELGCHQKKKTHRHVDVSLRHYYTCHEGLKLPQQLKDVNDYHTLDFGPKYWQKASEDVERMLIHLDDDTDKTTDTNNRDIPICSDSDNPNNEYILHGGWVEEHPIENVPMGMIDMTLDATWTPFDCKLGENWQDQKEITANHFRIGDSTMPGRIVKSFKPSKKQSGRPGVKYKIGFPYGPYHDNKKEQYEQFMEVLQTFRREYDNNQTTSDTFLYSGGLHHLLHGNFSVPSITSLVLRTVCQVGLTFPGNILLRGLNPLQQHQYHVVDMTSLNVRRLNWELHSRLRNPKTGKNMKLADICSSIPIEEIASFVALPGSNGYALDNNEAAPILLEQYKYSWEMNSTDDQKQLSNWIRDLSMEERSTRYGNRTVTWINLEGFLLSRPEVYRKGDKIHDSAFFWGPEWDVLSCIEGYV